MSAWIAFWSHALAAMAFAGLAIARLGEAARRPGQRLLLGAFALTACWAWLSAVAPGDPLVAFAASAWLQKAIHALIVRQLSISPTSPKCR